MDDLARYCMEAARPKVIGLPERPLAVRIIQTFEQGMKQLKDINALPPERVDNQRFCNMADRTLGLLMPLSESESY